MKEKFRRELEGCGMDKNKLGKIEDAVENYKDKSEEEIYLEIIRINEEIEKEMSYEEYEILFQQLKDVRPLLNDKQNIKLDLLLRDLKRD